MQIICLLIDRLLHISSVVLTAKHQQTNGRNGLWSNPKNLSLCHIKSDLFWFVTCRTNAELLSEHPNYSSHQHQTIHCKVGTKRMVTNCQEINLCNPFYLSSSWKTNQHINLACVVDGFWTPFQGDFVCHLNLCHCCFTAGPYQQFTVPLRVSSLFSLQTMTNFMWQLCLQCNTDPI